MKIEMWNVDDLIPYENNPRKNDHAVEQVAQAITEFGFRVPVLIQGDGDVIDGHLRLKAAKYAGLTEVPVMRADDMTAAQVKAFRISVNKVAELAKWDQSLLKEELTALQVADFDVSLAGFSEGEIDDLLGAGSGKNNDDKLVDPPQKPICKPGELWQLGNHLLLCGDSTLASSYKVLLGEIKADMIFTDPPYNVDYKGKAGKIKNDKMTGDQFNTFLKAVFACCASVVSAGGGVYVAHADQGETGVSFRRAFLDAGFHMSACLIWKKSQFVLGRADYQFQHEPILYGWLPGKPHRFYGTRKRATVIETVEDLAMFSEIEPGCYQLQAGDTIFMIRGDNLTVETYPSSVILADKPSRSDMHPTMKPVALVEKFIKNSSRHGGTVLDPFGGSGSTLIACEKHGRHCRTIELDQKFCDCIITRWQEYTGLEATRV